MKIAENMLGLNTKPTAFCVPGVVCCVQALLQRFFICIYSGGMLQCVLSSTAARIKFGSDNKGIGGNKAAVGTDTMRSGIGQDGQGSHSAYSDPDDDADDQNDNGGGGGGGSGGDDGDDGSPRGSDNSSTRGGDDGSNRGGGSGSNRGGGSGSNRGGGSGSNRGGGSGSNRGDDDIDNDGDDDEPAEPAAKSFDFYQRINRKSSAKARQKIKKIYANIQELQLQLARYVEKKLPKENQTHTHELGFITERIVSRVQRVRDKDQVLPARQFRLYAIMLVGSIEQGGWRKVLQVPETCRIRQASDGAPDVRPRER